MKYDMNELDKALKYIRANNGPTSIDIELDPLQRLVIKFTDSLGGDLNSITIYPEIGGNTSKFAEVTKTERLK